MQILKHLLVFVAIWGIAVPIAALRIPLPWGPAVAGLLFVALVYGYLLRPKSDDAPARRQALRLHPLRGDALHWTLAAIPVLLLLTWAVGDVYIRLVPVPPETMNPFAAELDTTSGRITIALLAIAFAPVIEEFFFRGLIQHRLETRLGPAAGIAAAGALFALAHFLPWVFPVHLFLGASMGFVVFATRSIWAGVIMHAANNVAAMAATLSRGEAPEPTPTLWQAGPGVDLWVSLLALAGSAALAFWAARRLWEAGREARLRYA